MTPQLWIPSSSRRKQRSLSVSPPLCFSTPPLLKRVSLVSTRTIHLHTAVRFTSFLFHPFLEPPSQTKSTSTAMTFDTCGNLKSLSLKSKHLGFLPHGASVEPPTDTLREEALGHGVPELLHWCQAGVLRDTSLLSVSEAQNAREVPQTQNKHSTWGETAKSQRKTIKNTKKKNTK